MINKYTFVLKYNWMLQYVFYKIIFIKFLFFLSIHYSTDI